MRLRRFGTSEQARAARKGRRRSAAVEGYKKFDVHARCVESTGGDVYGAIRGGARSRMRTTRQAAENKRLKVDVWRAEGGAAGCVCVCVVYVDYGWGGNVCGGGDGE
ncbi:uncharacterized protein K460DRAFT_90799 [Cucurbitaria berberidis CBS 394.84]|uniref:Uncharacterized protein n=1 Tax=Cucurbitaria berberidis CBS 394.84 TaxID=1168544 RepID=A0A9P4LBV0_9PLEO|nr:uncharacterized protein K460DRAFT_90799 [Cucurbitaria berberidis CBS 394.84]KAF1849425.1 hypothetical protein K460DRAFT_90799 [Cucurbitaria berberidis CBS 394.84]